MAADLPATPLGQVVGVFAGGPKRLRDAGGEWMSSIARDPARVPAVVERRDFQPDLAERLIQAEGLNPWWAERFEARPRQP